MPTILLAANWKMNTDSSASMAIAQRVASASAEYGNIDWLVTPPYVYVAPVNDVLQSSKVFLAAQDVSEHVSGAYTSQVSAAMAKDVGATHAIVGHSECRHGLGQTNAVVAAKFVQALRVDLTPILCVGETLAERDSGDALKVVIGQIDAVLAELSVSDLPELIVAYEPVWAIGTGVSATAADVAEMHAGILKHLESVNASLLAKTRVLYGGSVKESNAEELIAVPGVHGFLVGGASLTEEFIRIGEICSKFCY